MARNPRQRRSNAKRKQMKYTRVLATYYVDAHNLDLMASMLGQTEEQMTQAWAAADLMSSDIVITEYFDRYQLDLVKRTNPDTSDVPQED